jgi:hypothetical protein
MAEAAGDSGVAEAGSAQTQWSRLMEALLILTPGAVSGSIGNPGDEHIQRAAELRRSIPPEIHKAAQSPTDAVLLIVALLLNDENDIRERQLTRLSSAFEQEQLQAVSELHSAVRELGAPYRLPLMELAFPSLKQRPRPRIIELVKLVDELIRADGKVDTFEYLLSRVLLSHLRDADRPDRSITGRRIKLVNSLYELHTLFSVVARLGHQEGDEMARDAYQAGMLALLPNSVNWPDYDPPDNWVSRMDAALDRLDRLPAMAKAELVGALTTTISHDGRVTVSEAELLRAVCAVLHCPLPPFIFNAGA